MLDSFSFRLAVTAAVFCSMVLRWLRIALTGISNLEPSEQKLLFAFRQGAFSRPSSGMSGKV